MDVPLDSQATIIFNIAGFILFLFSALLTGIETSFSRYTLSERAFEEFTELKKSKRDSLLWILNHPSLLQRTFVSLRAIFYTIAFAAFLLTFVGLVRASLLYSLLFSAGVALVFVLLITVFQRMGRNHASQWRNFFAPAVCPVLKAVGVVFRAGEEHIAFHDEAALNADNLAHAAEMQETKEEKEILDSVLHFGEETVAEIMIPRADVVIVDETADFREVMNTFVETNYSRVPVCDSNHDRVKGVLYAKDLLQYRHEDADFDWLRLMRTPFFVPESKMIDDLMREFQRSKVHIAVVVDEYGAVSGIVTMEDILEEIVGEINDEYDEDERQFVPIDTKHFIFEGKTSIEDFFEAVELSEDDYTEEVGEAETLAGFVLELFDEMPSKHQKVKCKGLLFEVLSLDNRRISKIKVTKIVDANTQKNAADKE